MTIDKEKLRALAERAQDSHQAYDDFEGMADDQCVLALLAEIERLSLDNRSLKGSCARLGAEHAGMTRTLKKANRMQLEARQERDQIKAEHELLRLAGESLKAELAGLRTGYDAQNAVISGLKADREELIKALGDILALYEDDEGCRSLPEYIAGRAAMAKEASQ